MAREGQLTPDLRVSPDRKKWALASKLKGLSFPENPGEKKSPPTKAPPRVEAAPELESTTFQKLSESDNHRKQALALLPNWLVGRVRWVAGFGMVAIIILGVVLFTRSQMRSEETVATLEIEPEPKEQDSSASQATTGSPEPRGNNVASGHPKKSWSKVWYSAQPRGNTVPSRHSTDKPKVQQAEVLEPVPVRSEYLRSSGSDVLRNPYGGPVQVHAFVPDRRFKGGMGMKIVFSVPSGTLCAEDKAYIGEELNWSDGFAKVRIVSGDYNGKVGWVLRMCMMD